MTRRKPTPQNRKAVPRFAVTTLCVLLLAPASRGSGALAASEPQQTKKTTRDQIVETTFKSVDATIAAQWDFPQRTPAPLVVIIPSQGRLDRDGQPSGLGAEPGQGMYAQLTRALLAAGFAVFRFDKPGAGRSAPGRYATERSNAIEAYTRAVDHARVDVDNIFLLGHSAGSDSIAGIYPRYEAVARPRGVIFFDSVVGEQLSLGVKAPLLIVNPSKNPDDRHTYGEFVVEARHAISREELATDLSLIEGAEPGLLVPSVGETENLTLHPQAIEAVVTWLRKMHAARVTGAHLPLPTRHAVGLLHFD